MPDEPTKTQPEPPDFVAYLPSPDDVSPEVDSSVGVVVGGILILLGLSMSALFIAIGFLQRDRPNVPLGVTVMVAILLGIALYGVDVIVRSLRPPPPGSAIFHGTLGTVRGIAGLVFCGAMVLLAVTMLLKSPGSFGPAIGIMGIFGAPAIICARSLLRKF